MKIKCMKCNQVFDIPNGSCPICFSEVLGKLNDITDPDKRFDELSEFINNLSAFDYERGLHNAKCTNQIMEDGLNNFILNEEDPFDTFVFN